MSKIEEKPLNNVWNTSLKFPAEFWDIFNTEWMIQPMYEEGVLFKNYQLVNKSNGMKHGKPMDILEMICFMNESWEKYQKELESIILG